MCKYRISYLILGNVFVISTDYLELLKNQINHIAKFCYSEPNFDVRDNDNQILIEYIEEQTIFLRYKELIEYSKLRTICTFENEYHIEALVGSEICYMQLPDKYIVRKISNQHYILIGDGIQNTTKYVFRLIREIIVRLEENSGKIFMHGTSLVTDGYGICVLGNEGSGKTTYFSKLLSLGKSSIISNDRTFLYFENIAKMDYFPIPIVYKLGSVENNIFLKKNVLESGKYDLPESFKSAKTSFPVPLTDVPNFFPNVTFQQKTSLDMIIFSKIDFESPFAFESKLISKEEAKKRMLETCFTPIDYESHRRPWIYPRNKSDYEIEREVALTIEKIVSSVPVYVVEFGKDIYDEELYIQTKLMLEG